MKNLLFLLLPIAVFAQSFILSNIPLPKTYIQNLDPYECDELCMQEFLDNGQIFSFLAHADKKLVNEKQNETRVMFVSIFNLGSLNNGAMVKIALLLPYKKIGKYAASTTNAAFAYLMTKSHPFELKSYKIEDESKEEIQKALAHIYSDGFVYVIAPLTAQGTNNVIDINPPLSIYFPTIHKQDVNSSSPTLFFGAIDYKKQSRLLLQESLSPLVIFSDKSSTGQKLAHYQKEEFLNPTNEILPTEDNNDHSSSLFGDTISVFSQVQESQPIVQKEAFLKHRKVIKYSLSRKRTNLEPYLKDNEKIVNGTFLLNTPIIKTGMIMSQLTLYDVNATNILSTQINYDPLLLSMTQYIDRKDMVIANSITQQDNVLIEANALLSNDIIYNWINYTTTIGVDYFYSLITSEDKIYNTNIIDNQMLYKTELLKPSRSKFMPYKRKESLQRKIDLEQAQE